MKLKKGSPEAKAYMARLRKLAAAKRGGAPSSNPPSRSRAEKALDKQIEQAYYRVASGVQVSIMDIPKIYRDAKAELSAGRTDIDQVLIDVVKRYQVSGHGGRIIANPRRRGALRMPSGRECCHAPELVESGQGVRCLNCQHWEAHERETRSNPPAFFIIDAQSNKILSIVRGHPAKTFKKSMDIALVEAARTGRPIVHVVHPYVPPGFKVGSTVTSLFYGTDANYVYPDGSMVRGNPAKNPAGVLFTTPSKLEAEKIAGWLYREGVAVKVQPIGGQWGVKVHPSKFGAARHALGKVLSNPQFKVRFTASDGVETRTGTVKAHGVRSAMKKAERMTLDMPHQFRGPRSEVEVTRCNPRSCRNPGHRHARKNPLLQMVTLANPRNPERLRPAGVPYCVMCGSWAKRSGPYKAAKGYCGWATGKPLCRGCREGVAGLQADGYDFSKKAKNPFKNPLTRWEAAQVLKQAFYRLNMARSRRWKGSRQALASEAVGMAGVVERHGPAGSFLAAQKMVRKASRVGLGLKRNPGPTSTIPFKQGQIITVEQALAWARKTGNASLIRQCQEAIKLCKKSNGPATKVRFDLVAMGDPKKVESVMAGVEYGETDETVYKPTKGSKKGQHLYRHEWGEGSGRRKPVPLIAPVGGKALVMPLGKGQKASDWLRG